MHSIHGGLFVIFSGPEGAGKSTQIKMLKESLEGRGYLVSTMNMVRTPQVPLKGKGEILRFCLQAFARIERRILPMLDKGGIVLCHQYVPDIFALECFAKKHVDDAEFRYIVGRATEGIHVPDVTFWFSLKPEVSVRRSHANEDIQTRFSSENLELHEVVANGFKQFFANRREYDPVLVDAIKSPHEIAPLLERHLLDLIERRQNCSKGPD